MADAPVVIPALQHHEIAVLNCCLQADDEAATYVLEHVDDVDFAGRHARAAMKAIRRLAAAGEVLTHANVELELEKAGQLDHAFLLQLQFDLINPDRVAEYVRVLKEARVRRDMVSGYTDVIKLAQIGDARALGQARALIERLESVEMQPVEVSLRQQLDDFLTELSKQKVGGVQGLATGLTKLDKVTLGMHKGQLILIAGRPGMGKSQLGLHLAREVAFRQRRSVLFVSCEMAPSEQIRRLLAAETGIEFGRIRGNYLNEAERAQLVETAKAIRGWDLIIEKAIGWKMSALERCARARHRRFGLDLIVVDYIGLLGTDAHHRSPTERLDEVSQSLKTLALELEVPVVALAQLSREPEKRPDKRPFLSDLRDSGALEQHSDVVIFIYRDSYYDESRSSDPLCELIVAKQRDGETGTVKVNLHRSLMRFGNLDDGQKQIGWGAGG